MQFRIANGALVAIGAFCLMGNAHAGHYHSQNPSYYQPASPQATNARPAAHAGSYSVQPYGKYINQSPPGASQQTSVVPYQNDMKDGDLKLGTAHHGCNSCGAVDGCQCGCWFGYTGGLIMTRDHDDDIWFSYDTNDLGSRILQSTDADMNWAGGAEVRFGRYSDCGQYAWEAAYWGLYPGISEANVLSSQAAGDLGTILAFDSLQYDAGTGPLAVTSFYDMAQRHRLRRSFEFHNIELNLLGNPCVGPSCSPWTFSWVAGLRFFKFDEGFSFSGDLVDTTFDGAPEEINYDVDVDNNLLGFQIGGRGDYRYSCNLRMFAGAKLGVYGNHISHHSRVYGSQGDAVVNFGASPFHGQPFNVRSDKDDVAMLGELEVGMNYQVTSCWSASLGYRAVAVTGVALSTNQVPVDYFSDLNGIASVDSNGSMILHGAFAAAVYNF